MKYMMDTNICIYIIKHQPENVIWKFMEHNQEDICISAITYAGLAHAVEKSQAREKNRIALMVLLSEIQIVPFDDLAAQIFGEIKTDLQKKRNAHWSDGYIDTRPCESPESDLSNH